MPARAYEVALLVRGWKSVILGGFMPIWGYSLASSESYIYCKPCWREWEVSSPDSWFGRAMRCAEVCFLEDNGRNKRGWGRGRGLPAYGETILRNPISVEARQIDVRSEALWTTCSSFIRLPKTPLTKSSVSLNKFTISNNLKDCLCL